MPHWSREGHCSQPRHTREPEQDLQPHGCTRHVGTRKHCWGLLRLQVPYEQLSHQCQQTNPSGTKGLLWARLWKGHCLPHLIFILSCLAFTSSFPAATPTNVCFCGLNDPSECACALSPQLSHPDLVEGLVLINVDPCAKGWIDWAASKVRFSFLYIYSLHSA